MKQSFGKKLSFGLLTIALLFLTGSKALHPTEQLFLILMNRTIKIDVEKIKELLQSGADLNGRNEANATPTLAAIETYGYISANEGSSDLNLKAIALAAKEAAKFLIQIGGDVSSSDGRGYTPMMYLIFYADERYMSDLVDALLGANPNLGIQNYDLGGAAIHFFARGLKSTVFAKVLPNLDLYKINVAVKDSGGRTVIHSASSGANLKLMMSLLPENLRQEYADLPDETGTTPVMVAARNGSFDNAEYLLKNFKVDVNRISNDEVSPLSLALESKNQKLVDLLTAYGAVMPLPHPEVIYCDRPNHAPFTFAKLEKLITTACADKVKTIEDILPLLPTSLRSNYVLLYMTRGIQKGSFSHPRAIMYGKDGKFLVGFNGDPNLNGHNTLETIQFDDKTKQFEMHEIEATPKGLTISEKNPAKCLNCHGSSPRPLWDNWTLWPGAYDGDMQAKYGKEYELFQTYVKVQQTESGTRYKHLLPPSVAPAKTQYGNFSLGRNDNSELDMVVGDLLSQKMAREIAQSEKLRKYRYALLGGMSCKKTPIQDFLPTALQMQFPVYDVLYKETGDLSVEEFTDRITLQQKMLPGSPVGRYNQEFIKFGNNGFNGQYGRTFDLPRVVNMRYIIETILGVGSMDSWFPEITFDENHYVMIRMEKIEGILWRELLDPVEDASLYQQYLEEYKKIDGLGDRFNWIYETAGPAADKICGELKQKSLAALQN